jgi:dTDP-4-dehydrorhamnose reductase
MTTMLLGSTGLLGSAVAAAGEILVPDRVAADLATATVGDWKAILETTGSTSVLNTAAMARVDRCETDVEMASAVNAVGPGRLALACADIGVPLVHVSTDYVFGDQQRRGPGPYAERARHGPVQTYGATKAQGEKLVLAQGWYVTVVRVSWLFGPEGDPFGQFVLGQAESGRVAVLKSQQSRPTWVPDLARWLLDVCGALEADAAGESDRSKVGRVPPVLHPTGGPAADRGEWARAVLDARGLSQVAVDDQGEAPNLAADRPTDSRLDGSATAEWCATRDIAPILDWREGVRRIHAS